MQAAAHHSFAVQLEYIGRRTEAAAEYAKAAELIKSVESDHELAKVIRSNQRELKKTMGQHPRAVASQPVPISEQIAQTTKFNPAIHSPRVAKAHSPRIIGSLTPRGSTARSMRSSQSPYTVPGSSHTQNTRNMTIPNRAASTPVQQKPTLVPVC